MQSVQPWLQEYVIDIAEERGVQYYDAPPVTKWKTVQLSEFLYIPAQDQNANVWARASDSVSFMTVKFTKEGVANFLRLSNGIRLTQHKTAIIRIKEFRLILSAVPMEGNKMTKERTLVIECDSAKFHAEYLGTIGSPRDITRHADIRLWIECLRKDGGAGNILKDRRLERERKQQEGNNVNPKTVERPERSKHSSFSKPIFDHKERERPHADNQLLKKVPKDPSVFEPPERLMALLDALAFEGGENDSTRDQRTTPDVPQKQEYLPQNGDLDTVGTEADSIQRRTVSSSPANNADRSSPPLSDWPPSDDYREGMGPGRRSPFPINEFAASPRSGSNVPGEKQIIPESSQRSVESPRKVDMPSSLPIASYPHEPSSSKVLLEVDTPPSHRPRSRVARKIPPPRQPSGFMRLSGPERVLVPNSDTSMSQSQSQSQPQQLHIEDEKHMEQRPPAGIEVQPTNAVQPDDIRTMSSVIGHDPALVPLKRRSDQIIHRPAKRPKLDHAHEDAQRDQKDDPRTEMQSVKPRSRTRKRVKALELSSSSGDDNDEVLSADDKETDEGFIRKQAVGSSDKTNRDGDELCSKGVNTVATPQMVPAPAQTPGQHEPEAWRQPSFMVKKGTNEVDTTTGVRKRLLLKGFTVNIVDMKTDGRPWLNWKDMYQIFLRAGSEISRR